MCTVTWTASQDGYHLFMNRDELSTRGRAYPPAIHKAGSVRYLAPTDRDAGGTWIAVNEHGLTVCLLNHYPTAAGTADDQPAADGTGRGPASGFDTDPGRAPDDYRSRGQLVRELIVATNVEEVTALLFDADLRLYRPFTLIAMSDETVPHLHRWDGYGTPETVDPPIAPVSSSSFDKEAVLRARREAYARLVADDPTPARLEAYHRSHLPLRGPYSVCTHRQNGGSRSLTVVAVGSREAVMRYQEGPPCEPGPATRLSLARHGRWPERTVGAAPATSLRRRTSK